MSRRSEADRHLCAGGASAARELPDSQAAFQKQIPPGWGPRLAAGLQAAQPALPWLIVCLGIALRISQYSFDRSLFLDEAFVATNIAERSAAGLLQPLEFDQRAPAGFLVGVKLATLCLGRSDSSLRLLPLVSGILSVLLFAAVCRRVLSPVCANFALLLFALSPPLIFLSSDLKQYSTDALVATVVLLASILVAESGFAPRRIAVLGLTGGVALWFSFPAVFVLAGVGLTLFAAAARKRNWGEMKRLSILVPLWGAGFVSLWWTQLRFFESEPGWKSLWNDAFMPLIPTSLGDLLWFPNRFFHLVTNPVGLSFPGLGGLACLVGIGCLWRQSRFRTALLLAPIAVALLASGFRVYPVSGRSIIFMAPTLLVIISAGIDGIRRSVVQPGVAWMWAFAAVCICFNPAMSAKTHILNRQMYTNTLFMDYKFEEMKPLMAHIRKHWRCGDLVYLYSQSHVAFEYYADQYGFRPADSVRGIPAGMMNPRWDEVEADLAKLSGRKRVWAVFTHNWTANDVSERRLYMHFLDRLGRCLNKLEFQHPVDAAVYLYDLSQPGNDDSPGPAENQAVADGRASGAQYR